MSQKSTITKPFSLKHYLLLPLLGVMIAFSSCVDENKKQAEEPEQEIAPAVNIRSLKPIQDISAIPFSDLEKAPIYPGCEGGNEQLEKCMVTKISDFVENNFDTNLGGKLNAVFLLNFELIIKEI